MTAIDWLIDSDPAIAWQAMRDFGVGSDAEVDAVRARIPHEGWGAELLSLQATDGQWDSGTYRPGWVDESKPFFDAWTATHFAVQLLREFGLDPTSDEAVRAIDLVGNHVRWDATGTLYFEGESEPCINGIALANGAYFGQDVDAIAERLIAGQLGDGGWNCWADYGATVSSFHSTICALEGLLWWENAGGSDATATDARHRGQEYLLERNLFRRKTTRAIIDPRYTMSSYPPYWYYDILRGLNYLRSAGVVSDERTLEAVAIIAAKEDEDGRWPLENTHQGPTHLEMEGPEGFPSRWNTLRSKRVMEWAKAGARPG